MIITINISFKSFHFIKSNVFCHQKVLLYKNIWLISENWPQISTPSFMWTVINFLFAFLLLTIWAYFILSSSGRSL